MRIKVGGQIVDTDRIWNVNHERKSLLVENINFRWGGTQVPVQQFGRCRFRGLRS